MTQFTPLARYESVCSLLLSCSVRRMCVCVCETQLHVCAFHLHVRTVEVYIEHGAPTVVCMTQLQLT